MKEVINFYEMTPLAHGTVRFSRNDVVTLTYRIKISFSLFQTEKCVSFNEKQGLNSWNNPINDFILEQPAAYKSNKSVLLPEHDFA